MAKVESLNGKVVWITGASSGIGKAIAQQCAAQGAQVVLTARRHEELENVRQSLINPDQHISITADITDESQVRHAYEQVVQQKGRIDWLINNAGLSQRALIAETTMQTERAIMEVDYFSQVFLTKTVLPTFWHKNPAVLCLFPVLQVCSVHNIARLIPQPKQQFICGPTACVLKWQIRGLAYR